MVQLHIQFNIANNHLMYARGDFEDNNPFKGSGASGINQGTDIDIPELTWNFNQSQLLLKHVN
jgi:hypothetical protein